MTKIRSMQLSSTRLASNKAIESCEPYFLRLVNLISVIAAIFCAPSYADSMIFRDKLISLGTATTVKSIFCCKFVSVN
jgi:hypothetical protein